jgi:hypothetical protein
MSAEGVKCVFLKGVALGTLAYRILGVKQAWDIDLLIARESAPEATRILQKAGYERTLPGSEVSDDLFQQWLSFCKESLWTHQASGIVVELHTALVDNPYLLPSISVHSQTQSVKVAPGVELPTLENDELFAYLCVHGGAHAWARLKWLADVAALLRQVGPEEVERLYRKSLTLGAGRSSGQALLLCSRFLSLQLPLGLEQELRGDNAIRHLERLAASALTSRGATELDQTVFGTVVINLSHFLLKRGWRYKVSEIRRKGIGAEDKVAMPLPRALQFLYPILAVPRWVMRRYRMSRL